VRAAHVDGRFPEKDGPTMTPANDPPADGEKRGEDTMTSSDGRRGAGSGWSPELLTVLGAVLAVGVALGALIFTGLSQVRADMHAMETRLREDMQTTEARLREDMQAMEDRLREDMQTIENRFREDTRELGGDVGQVRERISRLEGRQTEDGTPPALL